MYKNYRQQSLRLQGYDYSTPGAYFVTICVQHWLYLFGSIQDDSMALNAAGEMIQAEWEQLPQRFAHVQLDRYVVMPNHFHGTSC